jgi:hypothetical protein
MPFGMALQKTEPFLRVIALPVITWSVRESVADHAKVLSPVQLLVVYVPELAGILVNVSEPWPKAAILKILISKDRMCFLVI